MTKVLRVSPFLKDCAQDKLKASCLFLMLRVYETNLWNRANVFTP